ncbi:hypothetical protein [Mesorhizobium sp.]|uniref:hypothetical protein n=1 Tax=Mesorhizobium sp. TaxID=1871066 RepID=UPI000FE83E15|nr:hypothetical protein [Mesorhizobium sp.]RWD33172.1 MAG: hypothetical protein EOS33_12125 [Mesorhizobium sp.]
MGGLPRRPGRGSWGGWETPTAPTVPEVPEIQTTLPTSAYGQTIPVVYGKCRLPAAYIWCAPILTVTSTHIEFWDTVTTTTSKLTARLRFARPLVPDSTWTMRKLYANGKLVYDGSVGYRQKGLKFTAYDGRGDQPRDPAMVREEGADFVSAHRGYLDIVVVDFDIVGYGAPPVFEAEWIQDGATTHDYDTFTTFSGTPNARDLIPVWDQQKLYGFDDTDIFLYSIGAAKQYFTFDREPDVYNYYRVFRYSRTLDRLFYFASFTGTSDWDAVLCDGSTGTVVATSGDSATSSSLVDGCLVDVSSSTALVVGFGLNEQLFCYRLTADTVTRAYQSTASWNGYSDIQCITPGPVSGDAVFYLCADNDLVKATFSSQGTLKSTAVLATFADALRYAVYDDGDLVVWTDAGTVSRVDGTTGAIEFTKSVPYQIEAIGSRDLGPPDLQRFVDELYFLPVGGTTSYFTDLDLGTTRSIAGASSTASYYFDGQTDQIISETAGGVPQRMRITSDDGTQRQLEDFLVALMEAGGFSSDEIEVINVDDVIDGAVIDVTNGVRDIAKSICEPYSIAIFERAGKIIFKRAFTDGAFAIDATLAPFGDIVDA